MKGVIGVGNIRCANEALAGVSHSLESASDFLEWADAHGDRLTWQHIQTRYECSRATAYRWLAAYRNVRQKREARRAA
jgi:hypothetical protein